MLDVILFAILIETAAGSRERVLELPQHGVGAAVQAGMVGLGLIAPQRGPAFGYITDDEALNLDPGEAILQLDGRFRLWLESVDMGSREVTQHFPDVVTNLCPNVEHDWP